VVVSAILSPELFGSPISAEFAIEVGRPCMQDRGDKKEGRQRAGARTRRTKKGIK
jgi:hypothetical protein